MDYLNKFVDGACKVMDDIDEMHYRQTKDKLRKQIGQMLEKEAEAMEKMSTRSVSFGGNLEQFNREFQSCLTSIERAIKIRDQLSEESKPKSTTRKAY